ncbi:hypothetical protein BLA29_010810 [Euroglyphus maynei]|uniref:Uncharacterized protein n=1 Tax=Euroglyphus maynei TaxID=6958 RepID=A0A1Y3BQA2_EURMA|nr:hypothetical protein BLA29_010810 [Euroglyphus maynei]
MIKVLKKNEKRK